MCVFLYRSCRSKGLTQEDTFGSPVTSRSRSRSWRQLGAWETLTAMFALKDCVEVESVVVFRLITWCSRLVEVTRFRIAMLHFHFVNRCRNKSDKHPRLLCYRLPKKPTHQGERSRSRRNVCLSRMKRDRESTHQILTIRECVGNTLLQVRQIPHMKSKF